MWIRALNMGTGYFTRVLRKTTAPTAIQSQTNDSINQSVTPESLTTPTINQAKIANVAAQVAFLARVSESSERLANISSTATDV